MATKLSSIKHRKSWLSIVGGPPTNDMSRHVVQCKQSASVSALVMLCASVTTLATHKCGGRGAATNARQYAPRRPARYAAPSDQSRAVATKPLCAGARAVAHAALPSSTDTLALGQCANAVRALLRRLLGYVASIR
ncbi:unnamed protein product [Chrysodeixis includens]|uniref:Uncharacterized protein n=1 Tax=Chrysodeixis includens TaxID=689277 RepID=A0A9N8KTN3_CHRIL|nr:unnamed protein product [Chrysodeixis includens]